MLTVLEMKHKSLIIILPLIFSLVFSLILCDLASAQWRTQEAGPRDQKTDLSTPPMKGPADAPVEINVFTCFK